MYEIERHIAPIRQPASPERFPFLDLEVGDSFLIPDKREAACARTQMAKLHATTKLRFISEKREGGRRFFRIN